MTYPTMRTLKLNCKLTKFHRITPHITRNKLSKRFDLGVQLSFCCWALSFGAIWFWDLIFPLNSHHVRMLVHKTYVHARA